MRLLRRLYMLLRDLGRAKVASVEALRRLVRGK
jgi:hypothetical protein